MDNNIDVDNFKRYVSQRCIGYNYFGTEVESAYDCEIETTKGAVVRKYLVVRTTNVRDSIDMISETLQDKRPFLQVVLTAE